MLIVWTLIILISVYEFMEWMVNAETYCINSIVFKRTLDLRTCGFNNPMIVRYDFSMVNFNQWKNLIIMEKKILETFLKKYTTVLHFAGFDLVNSYVLDKI